MLNNLKFRAKLILILLCVGLIPFTFIGIFSVFNAGKALETKAYDTLETLRDIKKSQVERFFIERIGDVNVLANNPLIIQAMKELDSQFAAGGGHSGGKFHGLTNERFNAPAKYRTVHDKYFSIFKHYIQAYGYYDMFFICPEYGDISFTVLKETDFGMRISDFRSGSLKNTWQNVVNNGRASVSDIKIYAQSKNMPAQFVASPIKENGRIIGVLALQISFEILSSVLSERSGVGETGETYLVGKDKLMRSDSYLDPDNHSVKASFANPSKGSVTTEAVREALSGKTGISDIIDYRGKQVLSAYSPVKIGDDITWVILSEIDKVEAFQFINNFKRIMIFAFIVVVFVISALAWFLSTALIKPVIHTTAELQASSEELKTSAQLQLSSTTEQAVTTTQISTTMEELVAGSKQVLLTIKDVLSSADETFNAAEKGNISLDKVVEGMEKINQQVEKVVENMLSLGEKSQQMGLALDIINELSEQTTILSYNATIEAAGAGLVGRRFSAIAEQIMKLANKAVESTKDVKIMIDDIQKSTSKTVLATEDGMKAVEEGRLRIQDSTEHFDNIITAAEQNLASTKEIDMTISQQATAIEETSDGVRNIQLASEEVKVSSNQVLKTAEQMMDMAGRLMDIYQEQQADSKNHYLTGRKNSDSDNRNYNKRISSEESETAENIV